MPDFNAAKNAIQVRFFQLDALSAWGRGSVE
jgi:hypothetical protein